MHTNAEKALAESTLQPTGIADLHLRLRQEIFPDARRGKGHGRADFAEILADRGRVFWTIDGRTSQKRQHDGEEGVADPGHRQIRHERVALTERVDLEVARRRGDQVAVGQHHAFGGASRP